MNKKLNEAHASINKMYKFTSRFGTIKRCEITLELSKIGLYTVMTSLAITILINYD